MDSTKNYRSGSIWRSGTARELLSSARKKDGPPAHGVGEWANGVFPSGAAARAMAEYEASLLWTLYQDKLKEARKKKGKKKPKSTCGTCPSHMAMCEHAR